MAHSYYKLPDDTEEVIRIALALDQRQVLMGEVNPVGLCRRLVAELRGLQGQLKIAKGGTPNYADIGEREPLNTIP